MLKGDAKRNYQREYMYKKRHKLDPVRPDVRPMIPGLKMEGNRIIGLGHPVKSFVVLPFCEWCQEKHEYGEHSRKPPIIDADGHPIPDY